MLYGIQSNFTFTILNKHGGDLKAKASVMCAKSQSPPAKRSGIKIIFQQSPNTS
jgi:hypothetical protein